MLKERLQALIDVKARRAAGLRMSVFFMVSIVVLSLCAVIAARMQVRDGAKYRHMAEMNSVRAIPIPPVRGQILDRNGITLAIDVPQFRLVKILDDGGWEDTPIEFEKASKLLEKGALPGHFVETVPVRYYPAKDCVSHIIGYVGEISPEELKPMRKIDYRAGDTVGKSGLEKDYERRLHGKRGKRMLSVDSRGYFMDAFDTIDPEGSPALRTTIDIRLQRAAYEALKEENRKGAIILMESKTGAILAMATYPSFDNNLAVGGFKREVWAGLHKDPEKPMINRATSVAVPSGSVFKMVTATAALESNSIRPDFKVRCPGYFRLGNRSFGCWRSGGHGTVGIVDAIAESCDVFFYTAGRRTGVTNIRKYAKIMGFGRKVGVDLPGESIGLLPSPEWKKAFRNTAWYKGDTVNLSIGQGFLQATPLQVLTMANVFASKGLMVTPHFVEEGAPLPEKIPVSQKTIGIVRQGMRGAVLRGTSVRMMQLPAPAAGKTGTADDLPRPRPHAWFTGFVPYDDPEITFVVFVENGGHGASDALPLALKTLQRAMELKYFSPSQESKNVAPLPPDTD